MGSDKKKNLKDLSGTSCLIGIDSKLYATLFFRFLSQSAEFVTSLEMKITMYEGYVLIHSYMQRIVF